MHCGAGWVARPESAARETTASAVKAMADATGAHQTGGSIAEATAGLTARGPRFETGEVDMRGVSTRMWRNAPATVRAI